MSNIDASYIVETTEAGFFTGIFSFFTTPANEFFFMEQPLILQFPLQIFLFPIAALIDFIAINIALVRLIEAIVCPKNFTPEEKIMRGVMFTNKLIKGSLIIIAVSLAVIAGIASIPSLLPLVSYLFVSAITVNTLFCVGRLIYHWRKMTKTEGKEREKHKQALIGNVVGTLVGLALLGVITGIFILAISSGIGLGILSTIGIVTMVLAIAYSTIPRIKQYFAKKAEGKEDPEVLKHNQSEEDVGLLSDDSDEAFDNEIKSLKKKKRNREEKGGCLTSSLLFFCCKPLFCCKPPPRGDTEYIVVTNSRGS